MGGSARLHGSAVQGPAARFDAVEFDGEAGHFVAADRGEKLMLPLRAGHTGRLLSFDRIVGLKNSGIWISTDHTPHLLKKNLMTNFIREGKKRKGRTPMHKSYIVHAYFAIL